MKLKSQIVPNIYQDEVAVMMATGPSLTSEVIETVRPYHAQGKVRVFGCNDTYKIVDYLDVFYACDGAWWDRHPNVLKTLPSNCHPWTQEMRVAAAQKINYIAGSHQNNLCMNRNDHIHYGSNSGFQQLNLAWHYGCRKFLLVGYNMQPIDNKYHYFGDHPQGLAQRSPYAKFVKYFDTISNDVKDLIINCTPQSALTNFKYMNLKEALECL